MKIHLPEIVAVGIFDADIAIKNRVITKTRKTTMFEIELPLERGGMSFINKEESPIEPDMIICAKPGQLRHTRLPFRCAYIHFIIDTGGLYESLINLPNYIRISDYEMYSEIFRHMTRYYETAVDKDEIILQSLLLKLIYNLINEARSFVSGNHTKRNNQEIISEVIEYIKSNLTSALSLDELSACAGFSPIHFHNFFKASTGKTPHEYVEEQRIKKAANMLVTTNCTLAEIAFECGFSSQSYFSFTFKRKMGKTPREYAREVIERYGKIN